MLFVEHALVRLMVWRWALADGRVGRTARRWAAQSTVEYALVAALIVIAAAGGLTLLGSQVNGVFNSISSTLKTAAGTH